MTETAASAVPTDARSAYGYGVATVSTRNGDAAVLDVWFPAPALGVAAEHLREVENADQSLIDIAASGTDPDRGTEQRVVFAQINLDEAPADTADAYLRLHLLSHRLVQPNTINLDGIFGKLPNVVWTNFGPAAVEDFELTRARLRKRGAVTVFGVDKFFNLLTDWSGYLSPAVNDLVPGSGHQLMLVVGVVEVVAGLLVAVRPQFGAYLVVGWLAGIIVNLLLLGDFYDVALRDFGLLVGALALWRLASRRLADPADPRR